MRKAVRLAASLHEEELQTGSLRYQAAMVTLTYAPGPGQKWERLHITKFLKSVRMYLSRLGIRFRYVWVAELQKRGAVHYHVMLWLPRGVTLPKPDKRGWWPYGSTKIEWAHCPVGYLVKYASKGEENGQFPKGARLHGHGGLTLEGRLQRS
jgi:hypothetical protein